jgi:hypothetical protein
VHTDDAAIFPASPSLKSGEEGQIEIKLDILHQDTTLLSAAQTGNLEMPRKAKSLKYIPHPGSAGHVASFELAV